MSMSQEAHESSQDAEDNVERLALCSCCGKLYHAPKSCRFPMCATNNFALQRQRHAMQLKVGDVLIAGGKAFGVLDAKMLRGGFDSAEMLLRIQDDLGHTTTAIVKTYKRMVVAHG